MNRKHFISSLVPATLMLSNPVIARNPKIEIQKHKKPPYLKPKDTIGITCPAGYISKDEIQAAVEQIINWGFNVKIGTTVGARSFTFGGTDEERLLDFQQMIDDPNISAIMCARGGYGVIRIIDKIDFTNFRRNPKWIIGFSDITILHCHLNSNYRFASIHSKMCNSFPSDWSKADETQKNTILSIDKALKGIELMQYKADFNINNRLGIAEGELIGGNLRCIENLAGTKSEIQTEGKILFIEDVGEYLYSIDRMFYNLLRSGKLQKLKGLIIGGFRIKKDDDNEEFGSDLIQIVLEKVSQFKYPVCFDFPVGHQKNNFALKCGVAHRLTVNENETRLEELDH